jgi:hypothetical protein
VSCAVYAPAARLCPGVTAAPLHTPATTVLRALESWARATATAASAATSASGSGASGSGAAVGGDGVGAASRLLQRLALSTGALSSVLAVVDVLTSAAPTGAGAEGGSAPLPPLLAAEAAAFVRELDQQFGAVGLACEVATRGLDAGEAVGAV